jgi:hypothetical protein
MAELILSAVALGLAGPGIALAFADCGKYFKEKIAQFKHAPSAVVKLGTFAYELYGGQLKRSLELAKWAYSEDSIDIEMKDTLEEQTERLRLGLINIDKQLGKCFDARGRLNRLYFLGHGERQLKAMMNELERWQQFFFRTISLIEMSLRIIPDPILLTPAKFKIAPNLDGNYYCDVEAGSHMRRAKGQILDGTVSRDVCLIIEQKRKMTTGLAEVKDIAACLSSQASRTVAPRGILRCLGYREEPLELVFELPTEFGELRSLENLIQADCEQGYAGRRPLDCRYRLAHQLSEIILSIHTLNRVHKNIRPDTILMIRAERNDLASSDLDFGTPYMTDWTMLRKINAPSFMVGENDWLKDIYRHPQRQGLQPETRYNMGHDIYSLGVCLLAIGLWKPLVDIGYDVPRPCEEYRETAIRLKLVTLEDMEKTRALKNNSDAEEIKRLVKIMVKPIKTYAILRCMAEEYLPSRMGIPFTKIVLSCLECLEGSFGDAETFEAKSEQSVGIKFNHIILQPLSMLANLRGFIFEDDAEI